MQLVKIVIFKAICKQSICQKWNQVNKYQEEDRSLKYDPARGRSITSKYRQNVFLTLLLIGPWECRYTNQEVGKEQLKDVQKPASHRVRLLQNIEPQLDRLQQ